MRRDAVEKRGVHPFSATVQYVFMTLAVRDPSDLPDYAQRTLVAYQHHAKEAIASWRISPRPSQFLRRFLKRLPAHARVLDYGCGIGTDLAWMQQRGLHVEGLDGTWEFVREARRRCPGVSIVHERFESVHLPTSVYDGLWCHAALLHVPPLVLTQHLCRFQRALKSSGLLGISLAWGRTKRYLQDGWIPGRYVASYVKREALAIFHAWSLEELKVVSGDGRQGRWMQIIARAPS